MSFQPPRDKNGNKLSHEEWMERRGMPYTPEQRETRRQWAIVYAATDHSKYTGYVDYPAEYTAAWKAVEEADRAARTMYVEKAGER